MNLGGFQLLDDTSIDTSNNKGDNMTIYHQQGDQPKDSFKVLIFSGRKKIHQVGNGYIELDIPLRKNRVNYI